MAAESQQRKVAVLGTATSTLEQAPVNDPAWEIWATGPWMQGRLHPRSETAGGFDAFFEIHPLSQFHPDEKRIYLPWLAECGKPVHVMHDLGLSNQVMYPKAEMLAQHGSIFFTSSIAWMLALAIEQRPAEIGVWGVDMADATEYAHQKAGCLHFIALARLVGINVRLPVDSELNRTPLPYPDRQATEVARVLTRQLEAAQASLREIKGHEQIIRDSRLKLEHEVETLRALQRVLI